MVAVLGPRPALGSGEPKVLVVTLPEGASVVMCDFLPSLLIQTLVRLLLRQSYGALSGIVELEFKGHPMSRTFSYTTIHPRRRFVAPIHRFNFSTSADYLQ